MKESRDEFLNKIKVKTDELEVVKLKLKDKFIGIDDVIDRIVDSIKLWYITPELQFRPHIISLWGITGVGKTDLVRTLVKLIGFTDKFVEIQMDVKDEYKNNIENYLDDSGIDTNEPSILLLDEIQRFRTVDENGMGLDNKYFNDIWMLLSDGKFQNDHQRRREISNMLLEDMYYADQDQSGYDDDDESVVPSNTSNQDIPVRKVVNSKYKTSIWSANRFKKLLKLQIPVEEIMTMGISERIALMENTLKLKNINEGKSYEKLLIFISGNLDEAFWMSIDVEEVERDADIFHALSKRINIVDIKNALLSRFKPEQIARFGNNHIIYPCLDKSSYEKIIKINVQYVLDKIDNLHNIRIGLSQNIFDTIYRNGVFPTQGVRPVISTIGNILGGNLPYFIYVALFNGVNSLFVDIDGSELYTVVGENKYIKKIVLDVDNIRNSKSMDEKLLVAVHELGHALVYTVLFKIPPKQITINSAGFENGFVINHVSIDSKTYILNQVAVLLSGLVAEEIIFGDENKSNGSSADILTATDIVARYIRDFGMSKTIAKIGTSYNKTNYEYNYNHTQSDLDIEHIMMCEKKRASAIINGNIKIFKALIEYVVNNGTINSEIFRNICVEHGMVLKESADYDTVIYQYHDKIKEFLNS